MESYIELQNWITQHDGYSYYLNSRFLGVFKNCSIRVIKEKSHIEVRYNKYVILNLVMENKAILLVCEANEKLLDSVQRKLSSEYIRFFNLRERPLRLTQYNMFAFMEYMDVVKNKIDAGFEKYSKLLEENIKTTNLGQLQISINNAFSLEELEKLIDAYNRLYSIIYCACELGINEITKSSIQSIESKHNMVLESIHIGSEGLLVSVGAGLIVELVKSFIQSVYDGDRSEIEQKKDALDQMEMDLRTRKYVSELIELLDRYLQKREQPGYLRVRNYIEYEIDSIVATIERLQGTSHIDVFV